MTYLILIIFHQSFYLIKFMLKIKELSINDIDLIVNLTQQLNPNLDLQILKQRQLDMFDFNNHRCFGCYENQILVGVISGWITVRLYSGKQLEIDNVIVDQSIQSKGIGKEFLFWVEQWAIDNQCLSVELNTYVENSRSHKFYFNQGYKILGYHFVKSLV